MNAPTAVAALGKCREQIQRFSFGEQPQVQRREDVEERRAKRLAMGEGQLHQGALEAVTN
jgi:hypothetical protein